MYFNKPTGESKRSASKTSTEGDKAAKKLHVVVNTASSTDIQQTPSVGSTSAEFQQVIAVSMSTSTTTEVPSATSKTAT